HGGPSKAVRALAETQAKQGHRVGLFTTGPVPHKDETGNLTVHTLSRGWPGRLCAGPGLANAVRAFQPEAIHAHGLWLRPLHHARTVARAARVPFVISPRGMMSPWAWNH